MAFLDFLLGKKEKTQEFRRFDPQQEQVLNQLLGGGQQLLPSGFEFLQNLLSQDPSQMQAFERPALRQFEEQIIPGIAERFTGRFGTGSMRSSAFGQQLGQAGAGLAEKLQAQRGGLGMQALSQLRAMLSPGLGQRTDTVFRPAQPGLLQSVLPGLIQSGGQAGLSALTGMPAGLPGVTGGF